MPKRTVRKLGASNKRAKKIRTAGEFPLTRLAPEVRYPLRSIGDFSWDADAIRGARDSQQRGYFWLPARLSRAMASDAGLFTARLNRLAPMRGLPIELRAAEKTTRGERVRDEGEALFGPEGIAFGRDSLVTLHKQYIDHGVAFGYNRLTVRPDASRVDIELLAWPIEFVRWLPQHRAFFTLTKQGQLMKIEHGDGRWVVIQNEKLDPWSDGCLVPACTVWADRSFAIRDRSNASRSHAQAKFIGELPAGMSIEQADGTPTPEAAAMLALLQMCHVGDLPYGLRPAGSKTELLVNASQAWQIWENMIKTNDQDADRVYLGEDALTTTSSTYVQNDRLFGVRDYLVKADLGAFSECLKTGTVDPWAAINFGDSRLAPTRVWLMPDRDEDARRASIGGHLDSFFNTLERLKQNGFEVTQKVCDDLARTLGVTRFVLKVGGSSTQPQPSTPIAPPPPAAPSPAQDEPPASSPLAAAAE